MNTADRYREAGMPPPRGEVYIPALSVSRRRSRRLLRETVQHTNPLLPERVHDPASDGPVLPEIDPAAYGSDSVPLDPPDANITEETS